jgi:hypothetical protein
MEYRRNHLEDCAFILERDGHPGMADVVKRAADHIDRLTSELEHAMADIKQLVADGDDARARLAPAVATEPTMADLYSPPFEWFDKRINYGNHSAFMAGQAMATYPLCSPELTASLGDAMHEAGRDYVKHGPAGNTVLPNGKTWSEIFSHPNDIGARGATYCPHCGAPAAEHSNGVCMRFPAMQPPLA